MNVKHPTDYNLVDRYLCGDEAAGNELYSEIIPRVRKYIFAQSKESGLSLADKQMLYILLLIMGQKNTSYI